jgi:hypothetical protein
MFMDMIQRLTAALAIVMVIGLLSCEKQKEYNVQYRISEAISGFDVNYRDGEGILQQESIDTQSGEDTWRFNFEALEGDILFVSARYKDPESAIRVEVLLDGKVFKQGSSTNDTTKYVTVSGTVPFHE